jgi:hypothetical protein
MPNQTTRSSRSAARPGRSGRPGSTARFARTSQRPASRSMPPRFTPRGSKKKSASGLGAMMGALPFGKSKAKPASSGRGKKGAGLALLTAAAGFAMSNRDKLGGLLHRDKAESTDPVTTAPPAAPTVDSTHTTP